MMSSWPTHGEEPWRCLGTRLGKALLTWHLNIHDFTCRTLALEGQGWAVN